MDEEMMMEEGEGGMSCPAATGDLTLNLKNRGKAIDKADYGPMDPNLPNRDYWQRMADRWDETPENAKKSPRAAKAMSMMPPPPGLSVASTMAKASYGPISVPTLPAVVPMIPVKNPKLANNWKSKTASTVSDEEVLAMPDDEYMNALQMAFFRLKLVQLKTDILANAGETTEHLREDTVIVPDPADRATIEEEHALELRTRDRERKLLKKIEQSISRIDSGDYGYCDETGEPIGVGRLLARPTATLSLEAQQRRELKQKMFGD